MGCPCPACGSGATVTPRSAACRQHKLACRQELFLRANFLYWDDAGGTTDVGLGRGRRPRRRLARAGAAFAAAMLALIEASCIAAARDRSGSHPESASAFFAAITISIASR